MAQAVAAQVFVAEPGDDGVPVDGVAQHGGGDAAAARSGEQAGVGVRTGGENALGDERADLLDDGDCKSFGSSKISVGVDRSGDLPRGGAAAARLPACDVAVEELLPRLVG
ncbi:hypothetical protein [Streptomyces sp. NPDC004284]|uniref:hypothetical protein n=1 Tax=Streptomyces sp. NPDC004284 TaxID=3364695 RepID=UPI0036C46E51